MVTVKVGLTVHPSWRVPVPLRLYLFNFLGQYQYMTKTNTFFLDSRADTEFINPHTELFFVFCPRAAFSSTVYVNNYIESIMAYI